MRALIAALAGLVLSTSNSLAWWDEGHMRIAAMAWDLMSPAARAEASRLLELNPEYDEWVAAVPKPPAGGAKDIKRYVFIRASVWADDIKEMKRYKDASNTPKDLPTNANAGQNIGYGDLLIHGYWHYKDIPFSTDGSTLPEPDAVNAVSQIKLFIDSLPKSAGKSDDIRSYDLAWLLHLVGDVHQPLHSTARFSKELTKKWELAGKPDQGDRGGNEIALLPATGEPINLHFYFDSMFGGYSTVYGAIVDTFDRFSGKPLLPPADNSKASILDPEMWLEESHKLALDIAYAEPVLSGTGTIELSRTYEIDARAAAKLQLPLAAARLANILNAAFP